MVTVLSLDPSDLKIMAANDWQGILIYADYSDNSEVSIPVNLSVEEVGDRKWKFTYSYADEPHADNEETIILNRKGTRFDGAEIDLVEKQEGNIVFVTTMNGKDNDKPAEIRHTYTVDDSMFRILKEVRYLDDKLFFKRNEYRFTRNK